MKVKSSILFDPQRDGYDTSLWKTLTGAPTVTANVLVFNNASAIQKRDIERVSLVAFSVLVPTDPTAGDARFFGLKSLNLGAYIGIDIAGTVASIKTADGYGLTDSAVITWDSDWTGTYVKFEFSFLPGRTNVYANGVIVGFADAAKTPKTPVSVFVSNTNADAMNVSYIHLRDAAEYSSGISATVTVDSEFPVASALADNEANPTTTRVGANMLGWDGSNWDRIKAGVSSVTSSLTGWLNTMPWAIFHATPTTRTTGQGGPLEADAKGNLKTLNMASLIPVEFDTVEEDYSGATADVYTYKKATVTVATITRNWTDATKTVGLSVVRT